jgi:hypothetical protein
LRGKRYENPDHGYHPLYQVADRKTPDQMRANTMPCLKPIDLKGDFSDHPVELERGMAPE